MLNSNESTQALLSECCDKNLCDKPVTRIMPNFALLGNEWCDESQPNAHIMDMFSIWSDVETKESYAVCRRVGSIDGFLFAAGHQIKIEKKDKSDKKVSIAGYQWNQNGDVYELSNDSDIADGLNEAWMDCDDWLYGPFFFSYFNVDGSTQEQESMPQIDSEFVEKSLLQMGFEKPKRPDLDSLRRAYDASV